MKPVEYIEKATRTETKNYAFGTTNKVTPRIEHALLGIVTEAGELVDAMKRAKIYGADLDVTNLIEETGDLMWYLALLCDELRVSFEVVWDKNIRKLAARYPEKYTDNNALRRNLKQERKKLES